MISELFTSISDWYMAHINYGTITLLMAIESSFIPLPSEIVIPPAAWKAAQGELNIYLVILFGTIGALIGSLLNYFLALFIGRKIIYSLADTRFANLMHIYPSSIEKAEDYFRKRGSISIFIGRLVPAIRHLISIPAGLSRMKIFDFILYTSLGAMIWNIILAALGYFLYSQKEMLEKYYKELSIAFLVLGVLLVAYFVYKAFYHKKEQKEAD
jgi:membrane protein DedA with SNARE-associated domain